MFKRVEEYRANKILFNFIKSNNIEGTVLIPANICADVVTTLTCSGLVPFFVDISLDTFCVDDELVVSLVNQFQVFLFVHTYGVEDSFDPLFSRIKELNPKAIIIDDRCLCFPGQIKNSQADLILFSTGEKKQFDIGIGGIGFIRQGFDYYNVTDLSGFLKDYQIILDYNSFTERKEIELKHKRQLSYLYAKRLPSRIQFPSNFQNWRFNILVDNKSEILEALFSAGLFASGHYCPMDDRCPNARWLFDHVINLFEDKYYNIDQANLTCDIINRLLR